jgi:hypothetical protein
MFASLGIKLGPERFYGIIIGLVAIGIATFVYTDLDETLEVHSDAITQLQGIATDSYDDTILMDQTESQQNQINDIIKKLGDIKDWQTDAESEFIKLDKDLNDHILLDIVDEIITPEDAPFDIQLDIDKTQYKQGETVYLSGQAKPNASVLLTLIYPNGGQKFPNIPRTNANGEFQAIFGLSNDTELGTYRIAILVDSVKKELEFQVIRK